jgi:hypothetical protein
LIRVDSHSIHDVFHILVDEQYLTKVRQFMLFYVAERKSLELQRRKLSENLKGM